jgi:hypothetical protein
MVKGGKKKSGVAQAKAKETVPARELTAGEKNPAGLARVRAARLRVAELHSASDASRQARITRYGRAITSKNDKVNELKRFARRAPMGPERSAFEAKIAKASTRHAKLVHGADAVSRDYSWFVQRSG